MTALKISRRYLWLFAVLLPCALFGVVKENNSWRPKVIPLPQSDGLEISWSPDNNLAIAFANGEVEVFDTVSQSALYHFLPRVTISSPCQLRFSPDGSQLAYADFDEIELWNFQDHQLSRRIPGRLAVGFQGLAIKGIEFTYTKSEAYLTSWNTQTGKKINSIDFVKNSRCAPDDINWSYSYLSISPDAHYLATVLSLNTDPENKRVKPESGGLEVFDTRNGRLIKQLLSPDIRAGLPFFSADSRRLAVLTDVNTAGQPKNGNQLIYIWDVSSDFQPLLKLKCRITSDIKFSPDGTWLAIADSRAHSIRISVINTGKTLRFIENKIPITCIDFSPDGRTLAVLGDNGTLTLWRLK